MGLIVLSAIDRHCLDDNAAGREADFHLPAKTPTRPEQPDNRPNVEAEARPALRTSDTARQTVDPEIPDSRSPDFVATHELLFDDLAVCWQSTHQIRPGRVVLLSLRL